MLTIELKSQLRAEKHRTQSGSITLLKSTQSVPERLSGAIIDGWISGRTRTAQREHLEFVLQAYRALPDGAGGPNKPINGAKSRVRITNAMRSKLAKIHAVAPSNYLRKASPDLTPVKIAHILSGRNKSISREAWTFFQEMSNRTLDQANSSTTPDLSLDTIEPPRARQPLKNKIRKFVGGIEYVEITEQRYNLLHREVRRTLVSPRNLLKSLTDSPTGFRATTAMGWYWGKLRSAERAHWNYLLERYAELPDRNS
ncbi:hypothetical protein [Litoreibacter roseus]|uniref:hypothetical protein n=1 Tax=Litoreibacter roseus TaxID=2601869 RepID=UPI0013599BE7|nr:hypothetical protein [Litoreibacter roseus]